MLVLEMTGFVGFHDCFSITGGARKRGDLLTISVTFLTCYDSSY